ncbi:alpha/beta hydrolase [Brevibacterium litoralis]|uniref:alpha/beta hydrolase n=1 Tax=Brevibacterium litoralis TaxID=3138935 RepID=UPI0032EDC328
MTAGEHTGANSRIHTIRTTEPTDLDGIVDLYPVESDHPVPAVLILPGGGFREHTAHNGEGYARWFNRIGLAAVVLRYALVPDPFPVSLQQARRAYQGLLDGLIPGVDPQRIGVIGSSAGGLLAGLLATGSVLSIEEPPVPAPLPRPAFHIQSYGVADLALLPEPAVRGLLGDSMHLAGELSPARHVDEWTPPTFVWATAQDPPGLPNALEWTRALSAAEVPVELHVFPDGGHGVGLADGVAHGPHGHESLPHTAQWSRACETWLHHIGIL